MGPGLPEITALVVIALICLIAFADAVRNLIKYDDELQAPIPVAEATELSPEVVK